MYLHPKQVGFANGVCMHEGIYKLNFDFDRKLVFNRNSLEILNYYR